MSDRPLRPARSASTSGHALAFTLAFTLALALALAAGCSRTGLSAPEPPPGEFAGLALSDRTPSNLGTEFWAVTTVNSWLDALNRFHFAVALGNPTTVMAHVTIDGGTLRAPVHVDVPAGSSVVQPLPWVREVSQHSFRPNRSENSVCIGLGDGDAIEFGTETTIPDSALVPRAAYHIRSSAPISAYQFNPLEFRTDEPGCQRHSYTNDASLLLPVAALRERYLVMGYHAAIHTTPGFVVVVGTVAGTEVSVTPATPVRSGRGVRALPAGVASRFTLGPGDVLELLSAESADGTNAGDLTGTEIVADHAVAVFSGVDCAFVDLDDDQAGACDHIEDQLTPVASWERRVVVSQLRDRGRSEPARVRVLAREDGTTVRFHPPGVHPEAQLNRGGVLAFGATQDFELEASAPVQVAQFMVGQTVTQDARAGDPAMVLEVPTRAYRTAYAFFVPPTYTANFANIVLPQGASAWLDEVLISDAPEPIPGTDWAVYHREVEPGSHTLRTDAAAGAGLKVYGVASYTSYAYPGGMNLEDYQP